MLHCCCKYRESIQLLPKTPADKKRLRERCERNDSNSGTPKINARQQLSRTHTNKCLSDIREMELPDFEKHCPDIISGQNVPLEEDDDKCLAHLSPLQPVATASCCTYQVNPDSAQISLFPELGDR